MAAPWSKFAPPSSATTLLGLSLASAAMILTELLLSGHANFAYSDAFTLLMPVLIFGGIAVGSLLAVAAPIQRASLSQILIGIALSVLLAFFGTAQLHQLGAVWIALPLIGFGVFMSVTLRTLDLRTVIWATGLGGGVLYVAENALVERLGEWMLMVLLALLLAAAALVATRPWTRWIALGVFLLGGFSLRSGALDAKSYLERHARLLRGAVREGKPIFSPLIRTDVLRTKDGGRALTTNGSRFAYLPTQAETDNVLSGRTPSHLSYDAPYNIVDANSVLVIGSAEGYNVLAALAHGAQRVAAVDINPAVFELLRGPLADHIGPIYTDPRVTSVIFEGRHFLETKAETYDLITIQGVQTGSQNDFLNSALLESFLYTEEATRKMWDRLTPNGVLYLDEYARYASGGGAQGATQSAELETGATLLGAIADASMRTLPVQDASKQCLRYLYEQNNLLGGKLREGVLISRSPIDERRMQDLAKALHRTGGKARLLACLSNEATVLRITDDRPFFVQQQIPQRTTALFPWAVLAMAASFPCLAWLVRKRASERRAKAVRVHGLVLSGIGYIVFVLGITGPATLLLGDPHLATPVVFAGMYVLGLVGGLFAIEATPKSVTRYVASLAAYLLVFALMFPKAKLLMLGIESRGVRAACVLALMFPAALLCEVPYLYLLKQAPEVDRGKAFMWENIGTLIGLPLGFACQVSYGSMATMILAAVAYALSMLSLGGASASVPSNKTEPEALVA
jgi:SAM-dependent methyltransferase